MDLGNQHNPRVDLRDRPKNGAVRGPSGGGMVARPSEALGSHLRFVPNLSMLWQDSSPYERFHHARTAGFASAEVLFPQRLDRDRLLSAVRSSGIGVVLFDLDPGDLSSGELGLLSLPGREDEFMRSVDEALELASALGTRMLNVLAGVPPPGVTRAVAEHTALSNLALAAARAAQRGVTLFIEAINAADAPGYLVDTVDRAARLVRAAGTPSVRLQLDVYHAAVNGDDPVAKVREHAPLIGHVQIADHPGRHEPGSGRLPFPVIFAELVRSGYEGYVGLEFIPHGDTDESLRWLPAGGRA